MNGTDKSSGPVRPPSREGQQKWSIGAAIGLVYLLFPFAEIISGPGGLPAKTGGVATLLAFAAIYMFGVRRALGNTDWTRILVPASMFLLSWALYPLIKFDLSVLWIFVAVSGAALFRIRGTLVLAGFLAALMVALSWRDPAGPQWELALTLIAVSLWMAGFANNIRINRELRATREELADLAVAAERARIGRDLHDILGHSLTAITVKAGLARRLLASDIDGATREIGEVEKLAREALTDVRSTAAGIRDVSLAGELAIAKSVLAAAGIRAVVPQAVDEVDTAGREVFGYVVREAVTNVVRHSRATLCEITVTRRTVSIENDGASVAGASGSGLTGLGERLAAVGGTLHSGPCERGRFRVYAELESGS